MNFYAQFENTYCTEINCQFYEIHQNHSVHQKNAKVTSVQN